LHRGANMSGDSSIVRRPSTVRAVLDVIAGGLTLTFSLFGLLALWGDPIAAGGLAMGIAASTVIAIWEAGSERRALIPAVTGIACGMLLCAIAFMPA
jgi:hypothetical protein